jgi:nucleoside-diphosphate-sugar epimerase
LETVVKEFTERGVKTSIVRLAQIHDTHKQGLVPYIAAVAREKRVSAYIGEGANRWPAAHVSDTARLYRLAFEKAEPGAIYHAVDEEGVSMKVIAEALGRGLKVPAVSIAPDETLSCLLRLRLALYSNWALLFNGLWNVFLAKTIASIENDPRSNSKTIDLKNPRIERVTSN